MSRSHAHDAWEKATDKHEEELEKAREAQGNKHPNAGSAQVQSPSLAVEIDPSQLSTSVSSGSEQLELELNV